MNFDMNRTWAEATAMARANWQFLGLIAGVFLVLPNLFLVIALPDVMNLLIGTGLDPAADGERAMAQIMAQMGGVLAVLGISAVASMLGHAAMVALLGPHRPTVGEALGAAMRSAFTLLACLALGIAGYLVFILLGALVVALFASVLALVIPPAVASMAGTIALMIAAFVVSLRFVLLIPVVMLERQGNPLLAFGRSWSLTRQARRRLTGFFALLLLAYMVLSIMLFWLVGLIGQLFFTGLISGLASAVVGSLLSAILVSLHAQLTGRTRSTAEVFD